MTIRDSSSFSSMLSQIHYPHPMISGGAVSHVACVGQSWLLSFWLASELATGFATQRTSLIAKRYTWRHNHFMVLQNVVQEDQSLTPSHLDHTDFCHVPL